MTIIDRKFMDFARERAMAGDGQFAIAYAQAMVAEAGADIAYQVKFLGNGDAASNMGAIEALGKVMLEGMAELSGAIGDLASR